MKTNRSFMQKTFVGLGAILIPGTSKYGTSLLLNALPSYRRLRLAEDLVCLVRKEKKDSG